MNNKFVTSPRDSNSINLAQSNDSLYGFALQIVELFISDRNDPFLFSISLIYFFDMFCYN